MVLVSLALLVSAGLIAVAVVSAARALSLTIERASGFFAEVFNTEFDKQYVPYDELLEMMGDNQFDMFAEDELILSTDFEEGDEDG